MITSDYSHHQAPDPELPAATGRPRGCCLRPAPAKLLTPSCLPRQAKWVFFARLLPLSPPVCCVVCVVGVARVWRNEQSLYRYSHVASYWRDRRISSSSAAPITFGRRPPLLARRRSRPLATPALAPTAALFTCHAASLPNLAVSKISDSHTPYDTHTRRPRYLCIF